MGPSGILRNPVCELAELDMTTSIKLTALAVFTAFAVLLVACGSTQTEDAVAVDALPPSTPQTEAQAIASEDTVSETELTTPETPEVAPSPQTEAPSPPKTEAPIETPATTEQATTTTTAPTTTTKAPTTTTEAPPRPTNPVERRRLERIEARAIPLPDAFLSDDIPDVARIQPRYRPYFPILKEGTAPIRSCEVESGETYEPPSPINEEDKTITAEINSLVRDFNPIGQETFFTNCRDYYSHTYWDFDWQRIIETSGGAGWGIFREGTLATIFHGVVISGVVGETKLANPVIGAPLFINCFFVYRGEIYTPSNKKDFEPAENVRDKYATTFVEAGEKVEWHCEPNFTERRSQTDCKNAFHPREQIRLLGKYFEDRTTKPEGLHPFFIEIQRINKICI